MSSQVPDLCESCDRDGHACAAFGCAKRAQNDNGADPKTDPALPQGPEAHPQGANESTCRVCLGHGATEGCIGCGRYKEAEATPLDVDAICKARLLGLLEALFTTHPKPESPEAARAVGRAINAAQHHLVSLERRAGIDGNV